MKGFAIPWLYTRRQLAQRWGVAPWVVDTVPWFEIETELRLMQIEASAEAFRKRRRAT
jgi:peptidoglycan/xylan/chitin deacetylase (PgdA/CDA1 family)